LVDQVLSRAAPSLLLVSLVLGAAVGIVFLQAEDASGDGVLGVATDARSKTVAVGTRASGALARGHVPHAMGEAAQNGDDLLLGAAPASRKRPGVDTRGSDFGHDEGVGDPHGEGAIASQVTVPLFLPPAFEETPLRMSDPENRSGGDRAEAARAALEDIVFVPSVQSISIEPSCGADADAASARFDAVKRGRVFPRGLAPVDTNLFYAWRGRKLQVTMAWTFGAPARYTLSAHSFANETFADPRAEEHLVDNAAEPGNDLEAREARALLADLHARLVADGAVFLTRSGVYADELAGPGVSEESIARRVTRVEVHGSTVVALDAPGASCARLDAGTRLTCACR
jgi:hypothetical protein